MATHSSILACRIPWTEEPAGLQSLGLQLLLLLLSRFSCVQLFAVPWTAAHQASLSITYSWSLLKLMSIESVRPLGLELLPGSSVHGISQARILEWVAISSLGHLSDPGVKPASLMYTCIGR